MRNPDARLQAIARKVGGDFAPRRRRARTQRARVRICCAFWRETVRVAVSRRVLSQGHADQLMAGLAVRS